jgi:hypothetical protein
MATVEVEGFDQYGTPSTGSASTYLAQGGWTTGASSPSITIVSGLSGQGYAVAMGSTTSSHGNSISKTLLSNYPRIIGGIRFNSSLNANVGVTY